MAGRWARNLADGRNFLAGFEIGTFGWFKYWNLPDSPKSGVTDGKNAVRSRRPAKKS
jgi:hypothetical protein